MRIHAAPAGRGFQQSQSQGRTRIRVGALLLLALAASSAVLVSRDSLASTVETHAQPHHLQPVQHSPAPPLQLADLHGFEHSIEQVTGRIVLVHFFATWCEPCRPELASLSELVARRDVPELAILGVNVTEPPQRLHRFFEKSPVSFPVLLDATRAATRAWGVSVLPTTFVLDRNGVVRLHVEGDLDWLRPDVIARLEEIEATDPK